MNLRVVADLDRRWADELLRLFRGEWWSQGRQRADVERLLDGPSLVFGVADGADRLHACTRVVSDGVYKAILFDVIVDPASRGRGLARRLLDVVLADPRLCDVEHLELYCKREHAALYARWGFTPLDDTLLYMRRVAPSRAPGGDPSRTD